MKAGQARRPPHDSMARMLQALKNLEARSAKTAGKGWLAQLAEKKPIAPAASAALLMPAPAEFVSREAHVEGPPPAMVRPQRRADLPPPIHEDFEVPVEPARPARAAPAKVAEIAPASPKPQSPVSSRKPSSLERQVLKTLGDPARSAPLVQLADRLRRDAEQAMSKTLLLVGVGKSSATHEAALYAAALLAEKHGERVLLIDADLVRRSLTEGLDAKQSPGLAELLRGSAAFRERCQATALAGVSLLPAGPLQDLSGAERRMEDILQQAAAEYSLVLIDGGRSSEPAATALARLADATYFVVQLGVVEASEAQAALRDFRAASAKVVGCIAT